MIALSDVYALVAQAQSAGQPGQGGIVDTLFQGPWGMFLLFAFIGIMFLLLVVQPERKKQAEHRKLLDSIKPNDRIVTIGGIYATVVQVPKDGNELVVRIDENNNTKMRITRAAVSRVIRPEEKDKAASKDKE